MRGTHRYTGSIERLYAHNWIYEGHGSGSRATDEALHYLEFPPCVHLNTISGP